MSAFLGPIHHWLYNKVILQEEFIDRIFAKSLEQGWDNELEQKTFERFGTAVENRPLEEIIDTKNIHGWLQDKISISEQRLAFVVTELLKGGSHRLDELKQTAYQFGASHAAPKNANAVEAYKFLNDSLLDGMPCDRVNEVVEQGDDELKWCRTQCVHTQFWAAQNGDIKVYYELKSEIIKGMLFESGFKLDISNDINIISRR